MDNVFPGETRILEKLLDAKPQAQWMNMVPHIFGDEPAIKDKVTRDLIAASLKKDVRGVASATQKLIAAYYGKGKQQGI